MHRNHLRTSGIVIALSFGAVLSACGSSNPSSSSSTHPGKASTTTTSSTTTSTTAVPSTTAPPSTTSPSTAPPPTTSHPAFTSGQRCKIAQLSVSLLEGQGAAGTDLQNIGFVNKSSVTCTLTGYPGVAGLDASGHQVAQGIRLSNGTPPAVVSLAPGQTASALIQGQDNPVSPATSCVYYPALLVTPPNETHSVTLTFPSHNGAAAGFPGCGPIKINPVVPGTVGRST